MRLSQRQLNRSLLARQHLLERTASSVAAMSEHLVGLQAQENLPPFLGLAARIRDFDPREVTRGLEDRSLARLLTMRGTIHLLTAEDALTLRQWTQPCQVRERKSSWNTKPAKHLDAADVARRVDAVLADGPLPVKALGETLAASYPDLPANALGHLARLDAPVAQLPPRGTWRRSGGVVYQRVDRWLGRSLLTPEPPAIVRRYLRAFGPASAADVTAWSGLTGMAAVLKEMTDLVQHEDESGRTLYDVPDGILADPDLPAPVRLLGSYDNVFLSHARRERITSEEARKGWAGLNGASGNAMLVDGTFGGMWKLVDGAPEVLATFVALTRSQRAELDEQLDRVVALLAVPPA